LFEEAKNSFITASTLEVITVFEDIFKPVIREASEKAAEFY